MRVDRANKVDGRGVGGVEKKVTTIARGIVKSVLLKQDKRNQKRVVEEGGTSSTINKEGK
jgi:hypothetical protein